MEQALTFRIAVFDDALAIASLVNDSYRGDSSRAGWTTEADILDGLRTSTDEITSLISSEKMMILLCVIDNKIAGSICLEKIADMVHVGMFVVEPQLQASGIGKQLLAAAENLTQETWQFHKFQMHVITIRHELIAFYERRGYRRTGILSDFPLNPLVWQPKQANLQLEILEKIK